MPSFLQQPFIRPIIRVLDLIHEHSRPNEKYIKDKREYQITHKRSKALFFNQFLIFCLFIVNLITGNGQLETNIQGLCSTTILCISTFTLNRFHPEVSKTFFNVLMGLFCVYLSKHGAEGVSGAWVSTLNFPILIYVATGSMIHFSTNLVFQMFLANKYYKQLMKEAVMFTDPDIFVQGLTYQMNQAIVYSFFFTLFSHFLLKEAMHQANVAEKKKDEFENQKNFLLGFSHELRNLINSLMGNVKLAGLEAVTEKAKDLLSNAELCAEMLLHLIINILDTGKVELGDLEINKSPVKIYDTMERVWSICSELIKNKNLRGRLKIQKDIPQVLTLDHYRLTQIFLNLVGNAVKYTDCGEIDISVEWISNTEVVTDKCFEPYPFNEENDQDEGLFEKRQGFSRLDENLLFLNFTNRKINRSLLSSRDNSSKGVLKITVKDTGIGIAKESINKLFQKFTQVSSDPSKKKLGTGLGLFITKELCLRMNGDVKVFSKQGCGSAFTFCLPSDPVVEDNAYLLDREVLRNFILRKQLKAMIVDDQQFNHIILREFLNKLGVEVVDTAENGLIAYHKYSARSVSKQDVINIVTMDLYMPIMDGKTSAQKIRELEVQKRLDGCLLMMISANCSESEISYCINKGGVVRANAFIKKPATIDEMAQIIGSYLVRIYGEEEIKQLGSL